MQALSAAAVMMPRFRLRGRFTATRTVPITGTAERTFYCGNSVGVCTFCQPSPLSAFRNDTRSFFS